MVRRKPVALRAYEALAERYAAMVDRKAENAYYERPATLSLLPPVAGRRVLDAGCGPGVYAGYLIEHGAEVVGIDASPKMIRLARKRLGKSAKLHLADLEKPLDFLGSDTFDIILCSLVLDYLEDWNGLFREFNRVLKGFGTLVFSTGHPFMDYRSHTETSYYETVLVEDEWTGFGIRVTVPYYRRSLSSILTPLIDAGFMIEVVLEPRPGEKLKALNQKAYERLRELPGFLCVRARKATASRHMRFLSSVAEERRR
jgi:SAM-dependent methyltransferase